MLPPRGILSGEPRLTERIDVYSLNAIGVRLYEAHIGPAAIADRKIVSELMHEAASVVGGHKFGQHFLLTEWEQVVDASQLANWDAYRDVARLGRKTRLPEAQRRALWSIFERVRAELQSGRLITHAELFTLLAAAIVKAEKVVFDFAVVDEAQDMASLMSGFSRLSETRERTPSSSLATSASASSSSHSRGRLSASIYVVDRVP
jgi:hypothetical protein